MDPISNLPFVIASASAVVLLQKIDTVYADHCPSPTSSTATTGIQGLAEVSKVCPDFKDDPDQKACCPSQINQGAYFCCTVEQKSSLEAKLAADARREFIANHIPEVVFCGIFFSIIVTIFGMALCKRIQMCKRKFSCASSCESTPRNSLRRSNGGAHHQRTHHQSNGHTSRNHHQHQRGFFNSDRSPLSFTRRGYSTYPYQNNVLSRDSSSLSKPMTVTEAPPPYESIVGHVGNPTAPPAEAISVPAMLLDRDVDPSRRLIDTNGSPANGDSWNCLIENVVNTERDRSSHHQHHTGRRNNTEQNP